MARTPVMQGGRSSILRGSEPVLMPSGTEVLKVDDVLAVVGSHHAIAEAKALLSGTAAGFSANDAELR